MRVYKSVKVHLIFSTIVILLMIWLSDIAGLWKHIVSIVMTVASLLIVISTYVITRRIPKHDDNIHFHERDEHAHIRS